jgi:hypothetical protein
VLCEYKSTLDVSTDRIQVHIGSRNMCHFINFSHILERVFVSRIV